MFCLICDIWGGVFDCSCIGNLVRDWFGRGGIEDEFWYSDDCFEWEVIGVKVELVCCILWVLLIMVCCWELEFREGLFVKVDFEGGVDCLWVGVLRFGIVCFILGCEGEFLIGRLIFEIGLLVMVLGDGEWFLDCFEIKWNNLFKFGKIKEELIVFNFYFEFKLKLLFIFFRLYSKKYYEDK